MARPAVSAVTEDIYSRLPEHYRAADARQTSGGGYPLLRWLAAMGDQLAEVADLRDRINYRPRFEGGDGTDTSDLVDPETADTAWLRWLGWLVGVDASARLTDAERRAAIRGISTGGWAAGSQESIRAVVRPLLTGERLVMVHPGEGDTWHIGVHTRRSETSVLTWDSLEATYRDWGEIEAAGSWDGLNPRDVAAAIARANVRPAGTIIDVYLGTATWDSLEAGAPTWADWEAAGSWDALEDI